MKPFLSARPMDITTSLVNLKHAQVMGQVQMRVAKKAMDLQEMQGASLVKMIDSAGQMAAKAGDALVAAATGLGGTIDMYG